MKWYTGFWNRIADSLPHGSVPVEALSKLDVSRIDVENVRSVLRTTTHEAKRVCETAVRRGVLVRKVALICPDGSVAWTGEGDGEPPATIRCWQEGEFGPEPESFRSTELEHREFYALAGR